MTITAPNMLENCHYRRLSVKEGKGKYRFETLVPIDFSFDCSIIPPGSTRSFRSTSSDGIERVWLFLRSRLLTIPAGYRWNGNSYKIGLRVLWLFDWWIGTPDFIKTIAASLPHDAIYQFSALKEMPFSLAQANTCYEQICRQNGFALTSTYKGALHDFSAASWGHTEPGARCVTIP